MPVSRAYAVVEANTGHVYTGRGAFRGVLTSYHHLAQLHATRELAERALEGAQFRYRKTKLEVAEVVFVLPLEIIDDED